MLKSFPVVLIAAAALLLSAPPVFSASDPGAPSWRELGPNEIISSDDLRKLQEEKKDFILFDARVKKDYEIAHIEGAVLPLPIQYYNDLALYQANVISERPDAGTAIRQSTSGIPRDKPIVTYCNANCQSSTAVLLKLKSLGFTDVRAMKEGLQSWEAKGYPVAKTE